MSSLGANLGFVDDLYARFKADPGSVSEAWREFFADYQLPTGQIATLSPPAPPAATRSTAIDLTGATPLVGAAARLALNMEASLAVPTATSARTIPVKLMEENRRLINAHQPSVFGPKVSFSHLIAWAILRALEKHPIMNAELLVADGKPYLRMRAAVNLGLAVDVERNGERLLVVPCIKNAAKLGFLEFVGAHDRLIGAARQSKLSVDDLTGTTVSITNPGMLGTSMSVPRLMPGVGAIFGIGRIDYPAEYAGMGPQLISELGLSKVMTVTSTYDHRIIQGAESGAFLADLEALLVGGDDFYVRLFDELAVPIRPFAWEPGKNPSLASGKNDDEEIEKQAAVLQLIRAFRVRGHLVADLSPLGYEPVRQPELELSFYGLSVWDLDREFVTGGLGGLASRRILRDILETLRATYCRHIGIEYMHIPEADVREWLQERTERPNAAGVLTADERIRILAKLNAAEAFERFLHTAYVGQKRFSLEGAEAVIPLLDDLLSGARALGFEDVVIGMSHRGRLNVLANIVGKSVGHIFREFEGELDPALSHGSGDVKYHLGALGTHVAPNGTKLAVTLASNPSHLEAVDPVVVGMTRARQDLIGDRERQRVLALLFHGDAAFSGQGVVAETLNLSLLHGYRVGGTIHVVINNQIGFTTSPEHLRSSVYATDVAKAVRAPIFHVNADHPEAVIKVGRLALEFRRAFKRDVVIDLVCYRRWGHNEGDDPSITHPRLYARIKEHRSVRKLYTEELLRRGEIEPGAAEQALVDFQEQLKATHVEAKRAHETAEAGRAIAADTPVEDVNSAPAVRTAVPRATLETILEGLSRVPDKFVIHPKLETQLARRRERFESGNIDWALAEALSLGSLLLSGRNVRLSGEDVGRGTFSQRHAVLYDYESGEPYTPLAHLPGATGVFAVHDSQLSEFAVMGFDYGYSVADPGTLVLWEAQFGDFANGAQVIIDQFLVSAEEKWNQVSGLTLLLPHGFEGQGPDHSSARIERFLQLAAGRALRIVCPSTPGQYFHVLRAQALGSIRTPLILFTPKSLLRLPRAVSRSQELTDGELLPVIDDASASDNVSRLILCTGKIYYDLTQHREEQQNREVALVRVEELFPWPAKRLAGLLQRYARATDVVWVQEEPRNMGAWGFAQERLLPILARGQRLSYVGRPENPSPATGSQRRHQEEQAQLLRQALGGERQSR